MRARTLTIAALAVAVLGGAALAACDLNPQPLPPGEPTSDFAPGSGENEDASGGGFGADAAAAPPSNDAGVDGGGDTRDDDAGDGGDGGDGGDAAPEASISG